MIVDLNHIPNDQKAIHDRLVNWARWAKPRQSFKTSPMFRWVKPSQQWEWVPTQSRPVDTADAQAMEQEVRQLPPQQRAALIWFYINPGSPKHTARKMGVTVEGLSALVNQGRMLLMLFRLNTCANENTVVQIA